MPMKKLDKNVTESVSNNTILKMFRHKLMLMLPSIKKRGLIWVMLS